MNRWSDDPMTRSPNSPISRSPDRFTFWRLWWRAISVKRSQAVLALGSLAVGAALTSMLVNLYGGVRRKMTQDFRSYGANVVIAPVRAEAADTRPDNPTLDEAALKPLTHFARETPGSSFTPVLYGVVRVSPHRADSRLPEFENVVATGAEFGALRNLNPGWRATGQSIFADLPLGDCAVGAHLASLLHLNPGDSVDVQRVLSETTPAVAAVSSRRPSGGRRPPLQPGVETYRVATILTTGASEDDQVFLPLAALQSLLGMTGKVTLVEVSIPGETRDVESAARRLAGLLPGLEVRPIRQIVYSAGKALATIRWLLLSLTMLILVIIALCVMATMTAIVLERRKDIGIMKTLGAGDAQLMRLFVTEGASLGLAGGIVGYAVGALLACGLATRLFGVALSLQAWTLPAVCVFSVALAVIAAQWPVRIVRAIHPTVVLKGE